MISVKYSTRLVIVLKNIVIKIPISRRGYLQALNEKKIWDKYYNLELLAELKWIFIGIICQKRYRTTNSIPMGAVEYTKELMHEFDFDNCDLYNPANWGVKDNQYILLDYGINEYIASLYK
jgi:hypothetical protein